MATDQQIIQTSKTKTLLLVVGSIGFVALGAWFLSLDPTEIESKCCFNNSFFLYAVGIASVGFFGLCAIAAIWRLFSSKPGLIVNSKGIELFAIGPSTFIPWPDVSGFSKVEVQGQKLLVVHLHNPQKYMETGGKFRRSMAAASYKMIGSPISISSNSLAISFEGLYELCETYFQRYANGAEQPLFQ